MGRARILLLPPLLLLGLAAPAWACLWYYGKNVKGEPVKLDGQFGNPKRLIEDLTSNSDHKKALAADTSTEPGAQADFKVWSDYAATIVHQGKPEKAIPILEKIEKDHPNEYIIAVNLGTAYELTGENEKALHWIQEGIRRNPDSHMGTEWLHAKILEAKMAALKDPNWIKDHSVLGIDFGTGDIPLLPWKLPSGQDAQSIRKALRYQLHERLAFVAPPDALVGGMIGDLADLEGLLESADHAVPLYDLALSYQPAHPDLLLRRKAQALKFAGQLVSEADLEKRRSYIAFAVAGVCILVALTLYILQRRRKTGLSA